MPAPSLARRPRPEQARVRASSKSDGNQSQVEQNNLVRVFSISAFPQGSLWRERPPTGRGDGVTIRAHHLPLPGGAPAPKNRGSLPPPSPPTVRRADAPGEAGDTQGGALLRFTAEDSGNPCQPTSNADSQAQPAPQRRGLRPLIVQICSCQNRAPPACATLLCSRVTHTTARA